MTKTTFLIVGVCAGPGNFELLSAFLAGLPASQPLAVVVALCDGALAGNEFCTSLAMVAGRPVEQVVDGAEIHPGRILVGPGGAALFLRNGRLHVDASGDGEGRHVLDGFLLSLADAQRENAAAVMLSLGGNDGAEGLRQVRNSGGLTFAAADGVAINGPTAPDLAEFLLPAREIGARLGALIEERSRSCAGPAPSPGAGRSPAGFAERQILDRHAPPYAVLRANGQVVCLSKTAARFLEVSWNETSGRIFDMIQPVQEPSLATLLQESAQQQAPRLFHGRLERGESVLLRIEPLNGDIPEPLLLVLFERAGVLPVAPAAVTDTADEDLRRRFQFIARKYEIAQEELEVTKRMLERSHGDLRNLCDSVGLNVLFLGRNLTLRGFTPTAAAIFNLRPGDVGRPYAELSGTPDYPEFEPQAQEVLRSGEMRERQLDRDENGLHHLVRLNPYRDFDGEIQGVVLTFIDVTRMAEAEEQQAAMIAELNHRVKNMLTVALGVVKSTLAHSGSIAEIRKVLFPRLRNLAGSYTLLSQSDWSAVSLRDILAMQRSSYEGERFAISGPVIRLDQEQALAISMILHELATNAVKYGALSVPEGKITISWSEEAGELTLLWIERDGPPPAGEVKGSGFGFTMIRGQAELQLGGTAESKFDEAGLSFCLKFPLHSL